MKIIARHVQSAKQQRANSRARAAGFKNDYAKRKYIKRFRAEATPSRLQIPKDKKGDEMTRLLSAHKRSFDDRNGTPIQDVIAKWDYYVVIGGMDILEWYNFYSRLLALAMVDTTATNAEKQTLSEIQFAVEDAFADKRIKRLQEELAVAQKAVDRREKMDERNRKAREKTARDRAAGIRPK